MTDRQKEGWREKEKEKGWNEVWRDRSKERMKGRMDRLADGRKGGWKTHKWNNDVMTHGKKK